MSKQVPQVGPEVTQRVAEGFAAAADGYDATGTEFFRQMGEHLVAQAGIAPGAIVLDIGCGKGAVTIPAARAAGSWGQVTGIDLAGPMLEHARSRGKTICQNSPVLPCAALTLIERRQPSGRHGPVP